MHIDAHLDWRDEVNGIHDGLSSPMRRASELPWVTSMFQVGLRAVGSARQREVDDAAAFGSIRVRAEELHEVGVREILRRVPDAPAYYISLDTDAIDPAIAPGINALEFGGLTYFEVSNLLRGIAAKGKIVGFDVVEIAPGKDHQNITSLLAARLTLNLLGRHVPRRADRQRHDALDVGSKGAAAAILVERPGGLERAPARRGP